MCMFVLLGPCHVLNPTLQNASSVGRAKGEFSEQRGGIGGPRSHGNQRRKSKRTMEYGGSPMLGQGGCVLLETSGWAATLLPPPPQPWTETREIEIARTRGLLGTDPGARGAHRGHIHCCGTLRRIAKQCLSNSLPGGIRDPREPAVAPSLPPPCTLSFVGGQPTATLTPPPIPLRQHPLCDMGQP